MSSVDFCYSMYVITSKTWFGSTVDSSPMETTLLCCRNMFMNLNEENIEKLADDIFIFNILRVDPLLHTSDFGRLQSIPNIKRFENSIGAVQIARMSNPNWSSTVFKLISNKLHENCHPTDKWFFFLHLWRSQRCLSGKWLHLLTTYTNDIYKRRTQLGQDVTAYSINTLSVNVF